MSRFSERTRNRYEGARTYTDIATQKRPRRRDRQRHEQQRGRGRPRQMRRSVDPEDVQDEPCGYTEQSREREPERGHTPTFAPTSTPSIGTNSPTTCAKTPDSYVAAAGRTINVAGNDRGA